MTRKKVEGHNVVLGEGPDGEVFSVSVDGTTFLPSGDAVITDCPYRECTFQGTQAEVDDHCAYVTMMGDEEHDESEFSAPHASWIPHPSE